MMTDIPGKPEDLAALTIRLDKKDNVITALTDIEAGNYQLDGEVLGVPEKVPGGFKIAIANIKRGARIYKYGYPIGIARKEIKAGSVVHIHNVASMVKGRSRRR